jgi:hypothetical protein
MEEPDELWTGPAIGNPRNQTQLRWATCLMSELPDAIRDAITTGDTQKLPSIMTLPCWQVGVSGRVDIDVGAENKRLRWILWGRAQRDDSPSSGWREAFMVEAATDVGLLFIDRICVAPDRASDAPENPYVTRA